MVVPLPGQLTVHYLVAFCNLMVGFFFNLLAFLTLEWVVTTDGDYGLFTDNHNWRYLSIPLVLSFLGGLVTVVLAIYYLVMAGFGRRPYHKIPFYVAIFTFTVVFLNVFGMIITFQFLDNHESLGYSAILDIIGTFFFLIGGAILIVTNVNSVGPDNSSPVVSSVPPMSNSLPPIIRQ